MGLFYFMRYFRLLFLVGLVLLPVGSYAGGKTNTNISVGSSTTAVLAANDRRRSVIIVNDASEAIYLAIGASAVLNRGIRLSSSGGVYQCFRDCPKEAINAISTSGSQNVTVYEESF